MAAKLKLTDAQIYTLRRMKSGTRYVMTGDGRSADENRREPGGRLGYRPVSAPSIRVLYRLGLVNFTNPKAADSQPRHSHPVQLTLAGRDAAETMKVSSEDQPMSTITREFTKEQLIAKAREQIAFCRNTKITGEGLVHVNQCSALFEIALASLEAEVSGRNPVLAYADSYRDMAKQGVESIPVWSVITDLERNISPLFTAPPSPVSVPDDNDELATLAEKYGAEVAWANNPDEFHHLITFTPPQFRAAMLQGAEPVTTAYKLPEGWVAVPVEPTDDMIVNGFESEPDESFSDEKEWEAYDAMSGCQQAAHRAKLCWAAMIAAAPQQEELL